VEEARTREPQMPSSPGTQVVTTQRGRVDEIAVSGPKPSRRFCSGLKWLHQGAGFDHARLVFFRRPQAATSFGETRSRQRRFLKSPSTWVGRVEHIADGDAPRTRPSLAAAERLV